MSEQTIRVAVADDQQIVREGLVALLELVDGVAVVGAAGDGAQALDLVAGAEVDVVLMDLRMPVLDGVAATRLLTERHPSVAVVVLTTYSDDESIGSALRAGARGYLTKDAGRVEIAAALRSAVAGQSTFAPAVSRRLIAGLAEPRPRPEPLPGNPDGLTGREIEVLKLIAAGHSNAQIATSLFIAQTTVKTHINHAFAKIGARNRADAVRYAFRAGWPA